MYPDKELTPCEKCGSLGKVVVDIWSVPFFAHKVPSQRIEGYFTFVSECVTKS